LAPIRRPSRNLPARRPNPIRDLTLEKHRSADVVRERVRAEQLSSDLPAIVESQVGSQMQILEDRLVSEFKELGKRAVDQSTSALSDQLNSRIETLEKVSAVQSKTLMNLRDSSKIAHDKVERVVDAIEHTLAQVVPGFQLEPMPERHVIESAGSTPYLHPQFQLEARRKAIERNDPEDTDEADPGLGRLRFCPACTSRDIRRTSRKGVFEQVLRLFFVAPFRCRACRHKFYKF
jgi:uncharacterized coiled-coil protein SlyX